MDRLGIDIGSKTIKVALMDEQLNLKYSNYIHHRSKVRENLLETIHNVIWKQGDQKVEITVTGSAGIRVAELFDIPFVQEVVALKRAVEHFIPDADEVLEMGGEDTKLIYLSGVPEQRMNTICAGGTGGFIETMAGLMGKSSEDMQNLAVGFKTIYPIASRCAVFAKSDVRPLLNAGAAKEDIAASVLDAVCTQAIAGLSCGRPLEGKVVLLGGPFHYIPAMRDAFIRVSGMDPANVVVPAQAHLFVVHGAAFSPEKSEPILLSEFEKMVEEADFFNVDGISRLPQLFHGRGEYAEFNERHSAHKLPRTEPQASHRDLFVGVDAGSTTMKVALIDDTGALVSYEYAWNEGDVAYVLGKMLKQLYRPFYSAWMPEHIIRRSCIVGYGEDFCKAAFRIDDSEVETVAHLRAATALEPDVDFLLDIGGQDIKCFYVEDGLITDIVLNEACSSGCGSLFDNIARSVRRTKEGFAKEALFAEHPIDLGTRCSVFMDSRVKHAQKEGASHGDIAAGVAYSTVRNALFKVVRQPDFKKVGKHIVVQGGAFANDAILRAFEMETGVDVIRPDLSQLMGAWGAALLARDQWMALKETDPQKAEATRSTLLDSEQIDGMRYIQKTTYCEECGNHCKLMVTRFTDEDNQGEERVYLTGNRCDRGAIAQGAQVSKSKRPPDMIALRNTLISAYDRKPQPDLDAPGTKRAVGIPRVLSCYDSYPFWRTFFNIIGCTVIPDDPSDEELFRKGMTSIPFEGACYPSKLIFGHAINLVEKGAEVLFMPRMSNTFARDGLLGFEVAGTDQECPLVERAGDLARDNGVGTVLEDATFCTPDFSGATHISQLAAPLSVALQEAGIDVDMAECRAALDAASKEYNRFFDKLVEKNREVLARVDAGEFQGTLVVGHPCHGDPGINHDINLLLGDLGYAVLEQTCFGLPIDYAYTDRPWQQNHDLFRAVEQSKDHDNLQLIVLRSFGCGIDALSADAVHDIMRGDNRIYAELKLDQVVDLAAVRIRLRSLAYANKQRHGDIRLQPVIQYQEEIPVFDRLNAAIQEMGVAEIDFSDDYGMPPYSRAAVLHSNEELIEIMADYGYYFMADFSVGALGFGTGRWEPILFCPRDRGANKILFFAHWKAVEDFAEDLLAGRRKAYGEGIDEGGLHVSGEYDRSKKMRTTISVDYDPGTANALKLQGAGVEVPPEIPNAPGYKEGEEVPEGAASVNASVNWSVRIGRG